MKELCLIWCSYGNNEVYHLGNKEQNNEEFITKLVNNIISILKDYDIDAKLLDKIVDKTPLEQMKRLELIISQHYDNTDIFDIFEIVELKK